MSLIKIAENFGVDLAELESLAEEILQEDMKKEASGKLMGALKRYGELMKGGKTSTFATGSKTRSIDKIYENVRPGNTMGAFKPGQHGNKSARTEALKSLATRGATAVGAAGLAVGGKKLLDK